MPTIFSYKPPQSLDTTVIAERLFRFINQVDIAHKRY